MSLSFFAKLGIISRTGRRFCLITTAKPKECFDQDCFQDFAENLFFSCEIL